MICKRLSNYYSGRYKILLLFSITQVKNYCHISMFFLCQYITLRSPFGHRLSLYLCINFLQYFTDTPGAMDKALSHYKVEQEQKCTHLDDLYNSKQTFYRFMLVINTFQSYHNIRNIIISSLIQSKTGKQQHIVK